VAAARRSAAFPARRRAVPLVRAAEGRDRLAHLALEIHPGLRRQLRPELFLQHLGAHLLHQAGLEVAKLEGAEGEADQAVHLQAQMLQDALDLPVLALAQAERDPAVVALDAVERRLDGAVVHAVERDALLEAVELSLRDVAMGAHLVTAQPAGVGMGDHPGEAAVVGEEEQPLRVDVEPADRHDAGQVRG
jgi:hypothetical protein